MAQICAYVLIIFVIGCLFCFTSHTHTHTPFICSHPHGWICSFFYVHTHTHTRISKFFIILYIAFKEKRKCLAINNQLLFRDLNIFKKEKKKPNLFKIFRKKRNQWKLCGDCITRDGFFFSNLCFEWWDCGTCSEILLVQGENKHLNPLRWRLFLATGKSYFEIWPIS